MSRSGMALGDIRDDPRLDVHMASEKPLLYFIVNRSQLTIDSMSACVLVI